MPNHFQRWKNIMKCVPFEEKRLAKWAPPYIVQIKYDGNRSRNESINDNSILLSSEENIVFSVPHINEQLSKYKISKFPFDGELYNHEIFLEGNHDLIQSIVGRTVNLHPRYREIEFWVFDLKIPNMSQIERLSKLNSFDFPYGNIKLAPYWICNSLDEIKKVYDDIISQGYEGIIVRNLFNFYEEKRSTTIMKFKPKKYDTYMIVGWNEEISIDGIPKGRIGSIILSSQEGDTFSVGAGLDADEKAKLWEFREQLSGHYGTVYYQHLTNNSIPKGTFDIKIPDFGI